METFIPFPSYTRSAQILSDHHLSAARPDSLQLIHVLWQIGQRYPEEHPLIEDRQVIRWRGHEGSLVQYARALDEEWRRRTPNVKEEDRWTVRNWIDDYYLSMFPRDSWRYPPWYGVPEFHHAERDRLRMLDPEFYTELSETTTA